MSLQYEPASEPLHISVTSLRRGNVSYLTLINSLLSMLYTYISMLCTYTTGEGRGRWRTRCRGARACVVSDSHYQSTLDAVYVYLDAVHVYLDDVYVYDGRVAWQVAHTLQRFRGGLVFKAHRLSVTAGGAHAAELLGHQGPHPRPPVP